MSHPTPQKLSIPLRYHVEFCGYYYNKNPLHITHVLLIIYPWINLAPMVNLLLFINKEILPL
jgi:hypothetical protein